MIAQVLLCCLLLGVPTTTFPNERALAHFGLVGPSSFQPNHQTTSSAYNPPSSRSSYDSSSESEAKSVGSSESLNPSNSSPSSEEEEPQGYSYNEPSYPDKYPARTPYQPSPQKSIDDQQKKKNFVHKGRSFAYKFNVEDTDSGNQYAHQSQSDGELTTGMYKVNLPDGRIQTVSYSADKNTGFQVNVEYEGVPYYPDVDGSTESTIVYKLSSSQSIGTPAVKQETSSSKENQPLRESYPHDQSSSFSKTYSSPSFESETYGTLVETLEENVKEETLENTQSEGNDNKLLYQASRQIYGKKGNSQEKEKSGETKPMVQNEAPSRTYGTPLSEQSNEEEPLDQPIYTPPQRTYGTPAIESEDEESAEESNELVIVQLSQSADFSNEEAQNERESEETPRRVHGSPIVTRVKEHREESNSEDEYGEVRSRTYGAPVLAESSEEVLEYSPIYAPPQRTYGTPVLDDESSEAVDEISDDKLSLTHESASDDTKSEKSGYQSLYETPRRTYGAPVEIVERKISKESTSSEQNEAPMRTYSKPPIKITSDEDPTVRPIYAPSRKTYGTPILDSEDDESKEEINKEHSVEFTYPSDDTESKEEGILSLYHPSRRTQYEAPSRTYGAQVIEQTSEEDNQPIFAVPQRTYGTPALGFGDEPSNGEAAEKSTEEPLSEDSLSEEDAIRALYQPPGPTYGTPAESLEEEDGIEAKPIDQYRTLSRTYGTPLTEQTSEEEADNLPIYAVPQRTYGTPVFVSGDKLSGEEIAKESIEEPLETYYSPSKDTQSEEEDIQPLYQPPRRTYGTPAEADEDEDSEVTKPADQYKNINRIYGKPITKQTEEEAITYQPLYSVPQRHYGTPVFDTGDETSEENPTEKSLKGGSVTRDSPSENTQSGKDESQSLYQAPRLTYGTPVETKEAEDSEENKPADQSKNFSGSYDTPTIGQTSEEGTGYQPIYSVPQRTYGTPVLDSGDEPPEEESAEGSVEESPVPYQSPSEDTQSEEDANQPLYQPPRRTYGTPAETIGEVDSQETKPASQFTTHLRSYGTPTAGQTNEESIEEHSVTYDSPSEDTQSDEDESQPLYQPPRLTYGTPVETIKEQGSEETKPADQYKNPSRSYGTPTSGQTSDKESDDQPIYGVPQRTYGTPVLESGEEPSGTHDSQNEDTQSKEYKSIPPYQSPRQTSGTPVESIEEEDSEETKPADQNKTPYRSYGTPTTGPTSEEETDYQPLYAVPQRTYGTPLFDFEEESAGEEASEESIKVPSVIYDSPSEDKQSKEDEIQSLYQPPQRTYGTPVETIAKEDSEETDSANQYEATITYDTHMPHQPSNEVPDYQHIYALPRRTHGTSPIGSDEQSPDVDEASSKIPSQTYESPSDDRGSEETEKQPPRRTAEKEIDVPSRSYGTPNTLEIGAPMPIYHVPQKTYGVPAQSLEIEAERSDGGESGVSIYFSPGSSLPLSNEVPQSSYSVPLVASEGDDNNESYYSVPPFRSSSDEATIESSYNVPPVRTSSNEANIESSYSVPTVRLSSNETTFEYSYDVSPVRSSSNEPTIESLYSVPPVRSSSNEAAIESSYDVPPVRSSSNEATFESSYNVPPVRSSSNEATIESSYDVPPVLSSSNEATIESSYNVPPVRSSSNEATIESSYDVPPVRSSSDEAPIESSYSTPIIRSSSHEAAIETSYDIPPVRSNSNEAPIESSYSAPPIRSGSNEATIGFSYDVPPLRPSSYEAILVSTYGALPLTAVGSKVKDESPLTLPSVPFNSPNADDESDESLNGNIRRITFRGPSQRTYHSSSNSVNYRPRPIRILPLSSYASRHSRRISETEQKAAASEQYVSYRPTRYEASKSS